MLPSVTEVTKNSYRYTLSCIAHQHLCWHLVLSSCMCFPFGDPAAASPMPQPNPLRLIRDIVYAFGEC